MLCHEGFYALVHENAHGVQVILLSLAYNLHACQNAHLNARKSNLLTCTFVSPNFSARVYNVYKDAFQYH